MKQKGMTLVETLVALSIFLVIMVAVGTFEVDVFSEQKAVSGSLETSQDAQVLLKVIMKELRSMSSSPIGAYPLVTAGTSTVSFYSDANGDGSAEQITYTLIGSSLFRVMNNSGVLSTTTLVTNVRNGSASSSMATLFQYFDQSYDGSNSTSSQPLTQPVSLTAVRSIKINLTLDVDPNRSPIAVTYSAQAQLRNLKTNL
jgi:prepilin-type N-terminal cleavage/methylation domain-containing protein